jgi:hypothetical protein
MTYIIRLRGVHFLQDYNNDYMLLIDNGLASIRLYGKTIQLYVQMLCSTTHTADRNRSVAQVTQSSCYGGGGE